jgi:hypothetical protein
MWELDGVEREDGYPTFYVLTPTFDPGLRLYYSYPGVIIAVFGFTETTMRARLSIISDIDVIFQPM